VLLEVACYQTADAEAPDRVLVSRDYAQEVLNESVNTNTLISSQDFISNGRFVQRKLGQPDTKYETFRLPAEMQLGEKTDRVRPFVRGAFGLLRVTGGVAAVEGDGEADFSVSRLFTLTSGGGVSVRIAPGLTFSPALVVSYTYLQNDYDFNNAFSQAVLQQEYGDFYNWNIGVLTYTPAARLVYELGMEPNRVRYLLSVSQLLNDSIHASSDSVSIDSASGLVSNRIEYRQDLGVSTGPARLAVQPFFQWSNISGKAASGLNLVNLFEVGADLVSVLKEPFGVFSELYVGASYVSGDNFEGYHIGLGGRA
jgi:hypothetical protein